MQHDIIFSGFGGQGALFAGQLLAWPPEGYVPPAPPGAKPALTPVDGSGEPADPVPDPGARRKSAMTQVDWSATDMVRTWQFYAEAMKRNTRA